VTHGNDGRIPGNPKTPRRILHPVGSLRGAFKATARPALDIEAYLLPIKQLNWKHNAATEIGIATGQKIPEFENHGQKGEKKKYTAPLEKIHQKAEKEQLRDLTLKKTILTHIIPPWWRGPKIRINTPKVAKKKPRKRPHKWKQRHPRIYRRQRDRWIRRGSGGMPGHELNQKLIYKKKYNINDIHRRTPGYYPSLGNSPRKPLIKPSQNENGHLYK
jgi:hypothetical protein